MLSVLKALTSISLLHRKKRRRKKIGGRGEEREGREAQRTSEPFKPVLKETV